MECQLLSSQVKSSVCSSSISSSKIGMICVSRNRETQMAVSSQQQRLINRQSAVGSLKKQNVLRLSTGTTIRQAGRQAASQGRPPSSLSVRLIALFYSLIKMKIHFHFDVSEYFNYNFIIFRSRHSCSVGGGCKNRASPIDDEVR